MSAKINHAQPRSGEPHKLMPLKFCGWLQHLPIPLETPFMFLPVHQLQVTSYKPSTFLSASCNARWIKSQFLKSISVDLDVFRLAWCFSSGYFVNFKYSSFLYGDKLWVFLPCYHYPDSWSFFSCLPVTRKDHFSCLLVIYILLLGGKSNPWKPSHLLGTKISSSCRHQACLRS